MIVNDCDFNRSTQPIAAVQIIKLCYLIIRKADMENVSVSKRHRSETLNLNSGGDIVSGITPN